MKKRITTFTLFAFMLISIYASVGENSASNYSLITTQSVALNVTTINTVYIGVSSSNVENSIVPEKNLEKIGFKYNPNYGRWESDSAYFYCISFVTAPINLTLKCPGDFANEKRGVVSWYGTVEDAEGKNVEISGEKQNKEVVLVSGTSSIDTRMPRVYSREMELFINRTSGLDAEPYSGIFTIKVTAVR